MNNQKKIGNLREKQALEILSKNGFWCTLLADKANGQPFDIIAIKNNLVFCFDVKNVKNGKFNCSRIENNQKNADKILRKNNCDGVILLIYFEEINKFKFIFLKDALKKKAIDEREMFDFENLIK